MGAVDFFEELRFIWELLAAEHLFALAFAKRRKRHVWAAMTGGLALTFWSCLYPFWQNDLLWERFGGWGRVFHIAWYITLAVASAVALYFCYRLTVADTIFLCVAGYALQHVEFVMVNEVLAKGVCGWLVNLLPLYVAVCAATTVLLYALAYRVAAENFHAAGGTLFEDRPSNLVFMSLMYLMLFAATFMCQTIFVSNQNNYDQINYLGAATDFLICLLILSVQYNICKVHNLNREKDIIGQLLYERKRQYELSRENIEAINHKCHDLKHQIRALKQVGQDERNQYIDELEGAIDIYDAVVETGNEVVNTILSEKSLNCERRKIKLSCIVDASHLDFMGTLDIYAIMGNALDNAIENVSKYQDADKRVISLEIKTVGDFLSIQTNNYCEGEVEIRGGLPVTTKRDREYHGFGMKSMRHLADKYGGSLAVGVRDNVFTLQILLPMPREFVRLYEEREGGKEPDAPSRDIR